MTDAGIWDTDLEHAIQLVSSTNACEPRATKALVTATFRTKGLLVIMFPLYTVQTMASNSSSRLLLTL